MTDFLLETEGVSYSYNSVQSRPSLDDVSISIEKGVKTAILGANGAGKSTLFYHFNGVLKPKKGKVLYNGQCLDYSPDALAELRSDVSVVVQNPDEQIFSATVEEDVAFGPMNMGMDRESTENLIVESLEKVGMLEYRKRPTVQLSYGQRKRVAIAGALACSPKVLILDEPTAGLDPQMSLEVMELADQLCTSGTTVIVSTHDVDLAYSWAEGIHVMNGGRLVYSGEPEPFYLDRGMVHASGLTVPHTFSLNRMINTVKGEDLAPYPRTEAQLQCKMLPKGRETGSIRIVPLSPGGDVPEVPEQETVGIYGFGTRRLFSVNGLRTDFYFNAVECCMMTALNGKDSVLYCDSGLASAAEDHIRSMEAFGCEPKVMM